MKELPAGTKVRMTEAFKKKLRSNCHHTPDTDDELFCKKCSAAHIREFGNSVGVVVGPVKWPDGSEGPEYRVQWTPHLGYSYHPDNLEVVP